MSSTFTHLQIDTQRYTHTKNTTKSESVIYKEKNQKSLKNAQTKQYETKKSQNYQQVWFLLAIYCQEWGFP